MGEMNTNKESTTTKTNSEMSKMGYQAPVKPKKMSGMRKAKMPRTHMRKGSR